MKGTARVVYDFLGSTHLFSKAVHELLEQKLLDRVTEEQVTASQITLLQLLMESESATVSDVAAFLGVSAAAASKAVDRLERRGLLQRIATASDRRTSDLRLTESGRALVKRYEEDKIRTLEKAFRQFPADELRAAAELLDRLATSLVNQSERPEAICLQCYMYNRKDCLVRATTRRTCLYNQRQLLKKQE